MRIFTSTDVSYRVPQTVFRCLLVLCPWDFVCRVMRNLILFHTFVWEYGQWPRVHGLRSKGRGHGFGESGVHRAVHFPDTATTFMMLRFVSVQWTRSEISKRPLTARDTLPPSSVAARCFVPLSAHLQEPTTIPRTQMLVLGMTSMGSTFTSVRSLRYVIYPVQVQQGYSSYSMDLGE